MIQLTRYMPTALLVLLLLLILCGCMPAAEWQPAAQPSLRWPPPPEIPRLSFVKTVKEPQDLGIDVGGWKRLWRGLFGHQPMPLQSPHGVKVDGAGRLLVVDKATRRVHLYDEGKRQHRQFPDGEDNGLVTPIDVAVDERRQRLFVSDAEAGLLRIYAGDGTKLLGDLAHPLLQRPTGLAINDVTDELLVVDSRASTVHRFALADLRLVGGIGQGGSRDGDFNAPVALTLDNHGNIYVVDSLNHRVQVFSAQGEHLRSFGTVGDGPGYFARPKGVAVDSLGNIHVLDAMFDNVQVFDREGRLLMAYGGPGQEPGRFWLPAAIHIDGRDRVYVSDTYNRRVQVFQSLREGELP